MANSNGCAREDVATCPPRYGVRVCAAIRSSGDTILVVADGTHAHERLHLPGGVPKRGESLKAALKREVSAETGYAVVPREIAFIAERRHERSGEACLDICFYAEIFGATNELVWAVGASLVGCAWLPMGDPRLCDVVPDPHVFLNNRKGQYLEGR